MTSYSPRIYLYKITFEEVPYYYYGVHKEKVFDEEYWGTPVTHKWCWELYTPKKQILEIFPFTDEGWIKVQEVEQRLIKPFYQKDMWCLNENCGGKISLKVLSEGGKRGYKNGLLLMTKEERKETNKKTFETNKNNKTGLFSLSPDEIKRNAKLGGETSKMLGLGYNGLTLEQRIQIGNEVKELGLGVHSLTPEQRTKNGKKGALINKQNNTGLYGRSPEEIKMHSSIGGKEAKKLKRGIHGLTPEEMTKNGKEGSKKTNAQRWMCLETGYVSNSGALSNYQKKRGIDTSKRMRIS